MVEKHDAGKIYDSRLFNGPIESINRKVKNLKRLRRGFRNFEHFRNRFLYAARKTRVQNGVSGYQPVMYFDDDSKIKHVRLYFLSINGTFYDSQIRKNYLQKRDCPVRRLQPESNAIGHISKVSGREIS